MMKPVRLIVIVVATVAGVATFVLDGRVHAHHRYAATYLESREITIEGDVAQWEYRNPHSFIHIVARNEQNQPQRWIVEFRGAVHLKARGVTELTFRPGQRVIITGSPGRIATDRRLLLRAIVRPEDGWGWRDAGD